MYGNFLCNNLFNFYQVGASNLKGLILGFAPVSESFYNY